MKRQYIFSWFLILLLLVGCISVAAEESDPTLPGIPDEFSSLLEGLPPETEALLPEGLYSSRTEDIAAGVEKMASFSYLLEAAAEALGVELGACLSLLGTVGGILLLSALLRILGNHLSSPGIGRAFSLCSTLALFGVLIAMGYGMITSVASSFSALGNLSASLLPLICALYALGGNVGAAAATTTGLSVYMTLMEELVGKTILPFCALCMVLALMGALDPSLRTGSLLSTLKKNYTTLLGFLMMLLLAMLGGQTLLAASGDSLAMRSVKFAAGSILPVVGGSIAELLRSVSAGVGYLRSTLGICALLLLVLTLLPILIRLLLMRLCWQLSASLADLLGCDGEKRLLEEFASLNTYLLSALCICASVLLLSLTLLIKCASALG